MNATDNRQVIVGLGLTGLSCARYLARKNRRFAVVDSRPSPPGLQEFKTEFPDIELSLGEISDQALAGADQLIVSPGVALQQPAIARAIASGVSVCGDIDLFCDEATAPVVAITGSNGKSTVTTLLGEMVADAGLQEAVGGNIGVPALDLLAREKIDVFVLELSSFQLERARPLNAEVATVLNISADHMDRYADLSDYQQAKHRIFRGAKKAVFNRQDAGSKPDAIKEMDMLSFGSDRPDAMQYGVIREAGQAWLACGDEKLLNTGEMKIFGDHNIENALAALALGEAIGLPRATMLKTLQDFSGLPHRCQQVADVDGVQYYNDSKATNVGAASAAIRGLSGRVKGIVLIAGGESKGADFSPLVAVLKQHVRAVVLLGEAAEQLTALLSGQLPLLSATDMKEAVSLSQSAAEAGDAVLLSPACASFDMFRDYQHRGEVFSDAVMAIAAGQDASRGVH